MKSTSNFSNDSMNYPESMLVNTQKMELAAKNVDKYLAKDGSCPSLQQLMNTVQTTASASGLTDHDYPILTGLPLLMNNMTQIKVANRVPLPPDIMGHFGHVQCHCMMGLFPEVHRAWLTVDSDIYIWTYEENYDLAYYDGLNETILCVGLIKPKPGVFHNFIKYLLILSTATDVTVFGVTFTETAHSKLNEIQVIPDPIFTIPTDGFTVSTIVGSSLGRLFFGTKEGALFEIHYQAETGWFGQRCKKINHSTSALSYLLPSFLNAALGDEDGIIQISIDNGRHILYILTEKGGIEVCDLGSKGLGFSRVTKLSQASIVQQAMHTVKTLDSQNFRPITSISAVQSTESAFINLVAVTQTGARLYLSTSSIGNLQPNLRPYTLCLQHVRLPPGYSANINVRPRAVHTSLYGDRNLILLSTVNEKDVLWCISSDLFPYSPTLMEVYTTINLDGPAIALSEVQHDVKLNPTDSEWSPLVIRQHFEPPKKYVVLTSQAVYVFHKLRPVDLLKDLLLNSQGKETEIVKAFFTIQGEDQACATSLILASLESETNIGLSEFATRAFFIFGGEPKLSTAFNQSSFLGSTFAPNIISTPAGNRQFQPNISTYDTSDFLQYSSKHNGLYIYLGRILRPIWSKKCAEKLVVDSKVTLMTSTVNAETCTRILNNLLALHNFLTVNTQLCLCPNNQTVQQTQQSVLANTSLTINRPNVTIQEAQLVERQSLDALKVFVSHCCQILGLWKILCEHQFHNLIGALPEHQQNILQNTTFKDLFLYGHEVCSILISTLINSYLGDNASVDAINAKLRNVCPSFYKQEDAAFSKANEKLKTAMTTMNLDEKEELINTALDLCKAIAPNLKLFEVCAQFTNLKAYKAVIELCYICGTKVDPDRVAEVFYKNNDLTDTDGRNFYDKRMDIYKQIQYMLDDVHSKLNTPSVTNISQTLSPQVEENFNVILHQIFNEILDTKDEMMHITLYDWMMSKQMSSELIKLDSKSLEMFLTHNSQDNCSIEVMELLWKYYETNNNHSAAAKTLATLGSLTGNSLDLKQRITYLARAAMCMSNTRSGYAPCLGLYMKGLEDKLEVAKVQEQVLHEILNLQTGDRPEVNEAIRALNGGLYQISQLYENFAHVFDLWECKLAIIDCSGYADDPLVADIWKHIMKNELKKTVHLVDPNDRLTNLLTKIQMLARKYSGSMTCFPLEFIVEELEIISVTLKANKSIVPNALVNMNIPMEKLVTVYNLLIISTAEENFWKAEEHEFHFVEAVAALINAFLRDHQKYTEVKRKIISLCEDSISRLLSNLYSKPNTEDKVELLRCIKAQLSRL